MNLLITNIGNLYGIQPEGKKILHGKEMGQVRALHNAWIYCKEGLILEFGEGEVPQQFLKEETYDAQQQTILPGLIDSHTHLIFAQNRESEFKLKIEGKTYEEIAASGGGILNSAKHLANVDEENLLQSALLRAKACIKSGTVALEIKSGYGLSLDSELKMLRVATKLKSLLPIPIKRTLLGAHALPAEYKLNRDAYISLVTDRMIPQAVAEKLVDYIDVFCEKGFFSNEETERILNKANEFGLKGKVHVNQLTNSGAVQTAIKAKALSADHIEEVGAEEIIAFKNSDTLPVVLPGCSFYLNIPYAPARKMIDAGLPLVLASDFNPGSAPSGNLLFIWSLACIKMKLMPEEAFNALTVNAAAALEISKDLGSITKGKFASFVFFNKGTTLASIPYFFAHLNPNKVMIKGEIIV